MRDELDLMDLADRYLHGQLDAEECSVFEERMRSNPELQQLVDDQRALHGGMQRLALRPAVAKAYRNYKLGKWLPGIGGVLLLTVLLAGAWWQRPLELVTTPMEVQDVPVETTTADTVPVLGKTVVRSTIQKTTITRDTLVRSIAGKTTIMRDTVFHTRTEIRSTASSEKSTEAQGISDPGIVTIRSSGTEVRPSYPGGFSAMHGFLQQNIRYPDTVLTNLGVVTVSFLVDEQGHILEAEVVKGLAPVFDAEALRVVKRMPKWIPGRSNGHPVKARIEVPIRFAVTR